MATDATSLWVCNGIAFFLCFGRLILRKVKGQRFNAGDYWTMGACLFLTVRVVVSHFILLHGTTTTLSNNDRANLDRLGEEKIHWLVLNSKLNLVSRFVLNSALWCLKMVVLDLCRRMIRKLPHEFMVLYTFWTILAIAYIAATVTIFVECRPFEHYWQLSPDPGNCVRGNMWLITYEVGNMITDAMLLALPFPILLNAGTSLSKRLRLMSLFSIGFFLIAVSIVRMIQGNRNARVQLSRTMWASIETLFACIVAMVPVLYTLVRPSSHGSSYYMSSDGRTHLSRTHQTSSTGGGRNTKPWKEDGPGRHNSNVGVECHAWTELESVERQIAEDASTKGILATTTVEQV